jgi:hypothetical protein
MHRCEGECVCKISGSFNAITQLTRACRRARARSILIVALVIAGYSTRAHAQAEITQPSDGQTVSGTVTVTASQGQGVEWVNLYIDGNYQASSPPYQFSWDSTQVSDGSHTISINAYGYNNSLIGSASVTVNVNNNGGSSGVAQITQPTDGQTVSGTVTVISPQGQGVSWINLYVDGNYLASSPPYQFSWDSTQVSDGSHTLSVTAYNSQDNAIGQASVTVTVDNSGGASGSSSATSSSPVSHFSTLPPGSSLPDDSTCAAEVRQVPENRPTNEQANNTVPSSSDLSTVYGSSSQISVPQSMLNRVDGNFTGTTDEIIQWASCKWGFDEDLVRAIASTESGWYENAVGDNGASFGIVQIKASDYPGTYPMSAQSTAFNLDYKLAYQRSCFEGDIGYLSQESSNYPNSDENNMLWGCVGQWYSGGWYDNISNYISEVQNDMQNQVWNSYTKRKAAPKGIRLRVIRMRKR